jgi:hypothetical protein
MSYQNYGLGKTYRNASEAFKDADYATAISRGDHSTASWFWGLIGSLIGVAVFGYCFWITIGL